MNTKLTKRLLALCCAGALALAGTGCSAEEPSSAANRLEEIQERGYIEVATEPYFSPYEFIDRANRATRCMWARTSSSPTTSPTALA